MEKNRVNLEAFERTVKEAKEDPETAHKTLKVEGKWRVGEKGPQFESELKYENGRVILYSDEPSFLGGGGTFVNPIQYCMFGIASCFAATFAKWAAIEGVVLEELSIVAEARLDMSVSFGLAKNPILRGMTLSLDVKSESSEDEIDRIRKIAIERCPAYYCLTEAVTPEIEVSKR
ncbi:MAG: OsmC family protein [Candidatus Thorarchaeota archaeon]|jgi:uncharacterized OsmC-like protein